MAMLNLGDDLDRARRAAEDAEWGAVARRPQYEENETALGLTLLALGTVLRVGEGVVVDATRLPPRYRHGLDPGGRWYRFHRVVDATGDGVLVETVMDGSNLRHGQRTGGAT